MSKNIVFTSGFVGVNEGKIIDCVTKTDAKGTNSSSFCNTNTGVIKSSTSLANSKKDQNFSYYNRGEIENSDQCNSIKDFDNLNDKIWDTQNKSDIFFNKDDFKTINDQIDKFEPISTPEELINFAKSVNSGDSNFTNGNFKLTKDINLKGIKCEPIGSGANPFMGKFDGNGFKVSNFTVTGQNFECAGFFGVIKNSEVINLTVDCIVKGGKYSGVIAGFCDNSKIECCCGAGSVYSKTYAAGLVGKNTGEIIKSYSLGNASGLGFITPLTLSMIGISVLSLTALIISTVIILQSMQTSLQYPEIPVDPNINKNSETMSQSTDSDYTTVRLDVKSSDLHAQTGLSTVQVDAVNPTGSSMNMVVKLYTTNDEEIATSGVVPIGTTLKSVWLHPLPDGRILQKGVYDIKVKISYYHPETGKKNILETGTSGKLTIES